MPVWLIVLLLPVAGLVGIACAIALLLAAAMVLEWLEHKADQ